MVNECADLTCSLGSCSLGSCNEEDTEVCVPLLVSAM